MMVLTRALVLGVLVVAGQQMPAVSLSDADTVKSLYASASYEDVLQHIERMPAAAITAQIEQLRALSLLALGRRPEAEQAIERMVRLAPLATIDENEVSPRVAVVFRDVRERALPAVARELYAAGKASFEARNYPQATDRLRSLLTLLQQPEIARQADPGGDIKQLAEGFLRLADLEVAAATRAAEAAAPTRPAAAPNPDALTITKIEIYAAGDAGVTPPVELDRRMPPWAPPPVMLRNAEFRGLLEIVVNEIGAVDSAVMIRPTVETYDVLLLDAAKRWRFSPARRGTETVKYRLTYDVTLTPRR